MAADSAQEFLAANIKEGADQMSIDGSPGTPSPLGDNDDPHSVGLRLDERHLSSGHWHALRPNQIEALHDLLAKRRNQGPDATRDVVKMIIGLALITGKTIDEVLDIPINVPLINNDGTVCADSIQEKSTNPGLWNGAYMFWRAGFSKDMLIDWPIPRPISYTLSHYFNRVDGKRLYECLPPSDEPWNVKTNRVLAQTLSTTERIANIQLRDALLREAYKVDGNKALVTWLCPSRKNHGQGNRNGMISLPYYLSHHAHRNVQSYNKACEALLGYSPNNWFRCDSNYLLSKEDVRNWIGCLLSEIAGPQDKVNPIVACHNAFTIYTVSMLIAGTGHRESKTPFFFFWDLLTNEKLAFISDKQVVGSEARFVPLIDPVIAQVNAYRRHLIALYEFMKHSHPGVGRHIEALISLHHADTFCNEDETTQGEAFSQFFLIGQNGRIKTVGTSAINWSIKQSGNSFRVSLLRKNLANHLYLMGLDGYCLEALLGHSNELHHQGEASTWNVGDVADKATPLITKYLEEQGWVVTESPLLQKKHRNLMPIPVIPSYRTGKNAYEGRRRDSRLAMARARRAAVDVLSEEFLTDPNQVIDDAELKAIKERIKDVMGSDEEGIRKIGYALTNQIESLRANGVVISVSSANTVRVEPSPVEISFSRHIAIANKMRGSWSSRVGANLSDKASQIERAAHLAISLVVFDAVLDRGRLWQLLNLDEATVEAKGGSLILRAKIETNRFEYDYLHVASPVTSACLMGCLATRVAVEEGDKQYWRDLESCISALLTKELGRIPGLGKWSLQHLIEVFRAWWFIRLPGTLYSIAIGNHVGPAPHPLSLGAILSKEPLRSDSAFSAEELVPDTISRRETESSPVKAKTLFTDFLGSIGGNVEQGTANERSRKMRLRSSRGAIDIKLQQLCDTQPMVDLMVSFVFRLLDKGGSRKKELKFNTIYKYPNQIASAVFEHAWGEDPEEWAVEDYIDFYDKVKRQFEHKKDNWALPLRYFHQHLREVLGAPYISSMASPTVVKQRCRTSILTDMQFKAAYETFAGGLKGRHAIYGTEAVSMMCVGYGYGARRTEALGIQPSHFVGGAKTMSLELVHNRIRGMKSPAGRRLIQRPYIDMNLLKPLRQQINFASKTPKDIAYVFQTTDRANKILSRSLLVNPVVDVIRNVANNPDLVYQDLRRTKATRMMLAAFPPVWPVEVSRLAREAILGRGHEVDLPDVMEITSTPKHSPFVVDGVARDIGHSPVDTLLNVYFVGSAFVLAEHVHRACSDIRIDDARLANLIGKERSAITHLRRRMKQKTTDSPVGVVDLIGYYVSKFEQEEAALRSTREGQQGSHPKHIRDKAESKSSRDNAMPVKWVQFDRLLIERKNLQLSLDVLVDMATGQEYGLGAQQTKLFFAAYQDLVMELGYEDFEPENSDLIVTAPARDDGVIRGSLEREHVLGGAQVKCASDEEFQEKLKSICDSWRLNLNARDPWFVAATMEQLETTLKVLKRLGVLEQQIEIRWAGMITDPLVKALLIPYPNAKQHTSSRFSGGNPRARVSEIGIRVNQAAGAQFGDGRDAHRLFAVIFCALKSLDQ